MRLKTRNILKSRGRRIQKATPTTFEKIELALKILTFIALVSGGLWAFYLYHQAGADEWQNNVTLETKVLPYHDDLRLLVVHVISKNPRSSKFTLDVKHGDIFKLRIQKIPMDSKAGTVISENEDEANLIETIDLLGNDSGEYELLPNAELDDMNSIVLPVHTMVQVTAEMEIPNGDIDKDGKPDTDYISRSTAVRIEP